MEPEDLEDNDFPIPEEISISSPIEFQDIITPSLMASPEAQPDSPEEQFEKPADTSDTFSGNCAKFKENRETDVGCVDQTDNEEDADDQADFGVIRHLDENSNERGDVENGAKKRDIACWVCHLECVDFGCSLCVRAFHTICMESGTAGGTPDWICPVCERVSDAECVDAPTNLAEFVSQEMLCVMLKQAISTCKPRINDLFHFPVSLDHFPTYPDFVIHPMDLLTLESNCKDLKYTSTTAFEADVDWIYHNSCVFNSVQSPISKLAKRAVNNLKAEVEIIELCPSCYSNNLNANGFVQLCRDPHEPVWAKVTGFPYWPAKVVREKNMQVEVQFFGDHDRAWISKNKVLRMSKSVPENPKHNQKAFEISMQELKQYVENLQLETNFKFSVHRTSFTGENKISRLHHSASRRLSSFDYAFEDSKPKIKHEPRDTESPDNKMNEEKIIAIKEEPLDDAFDPPESNQKISDATKTVPQLGPNNEADSDVDNFDMRFHFLSTLTGSKFLRNWDHLEKDWISESEESGNEERPRCDIDRVVTAVQNQFSSNSCSLPPNLMQTPSYSTSTCSSSKSSFSSPIMSHRRHSGIFASQSAIRESSNSIAASSNLDVFNFNDKSQNYVNVPSTSTLNMQVRQTLQPISPGANPVYAFCNWNNSTGENSNSGFLLAPDSNTINSLNIDNRSLQNRFIPDCSFGTQSDRKQDICPQLRKRLSEDMLGKANETSGGATPPVRPRLEVKGTPNIEAQLQGSLAEAKIVDKVTEKLSDSLQTMVESFLSNKMNVGNVSSSSSSSAELHCKGSLLSEVQSTESLQRQITELQGELKLAKDQRREEVIELKNCYEYLLAEVMQSAQAAFKTELEKFKSTSVNDIKSKQWCSVCKKEAFYSCCWNTSYCSADCQKHHWPIHSPVCTHVSTAPQPQPTISPSNHTMRPVTSIPSVTRPTAFPNLQDAARIVCSEPGNNHLSSTVRFLNQSFSLGLDSSITSATFSTPLSQAGETSTLQPNPHSNKVRVLQRNTPLRLNPNSTPGSKSSPKVQSVVSLASQDY